MDKPMELKLRVLHELMYQAIAFPQLATAYTTFVRCLRERYHPIGVKDIQIAQLNSGLQCQVNLGDRLGADIYYGYYQEYFDSQLFLSFIQPGATVLDIGANFGYYSLLASTKMGQKGLVLAFEPNPEAYELLSQNITLNNLDHLIKPQQICLGAEDGETDFYLTEESSFSGIGATGRAKIKEKVRIPLYRLDTFLSKLEIPSIDVMKIDVEGYEFAVLESAQITLQNSPNSLIMLEVSAKNLDQEKSDALIKVLQTLYNLGFQGWLISSDTEKLTPLQTPEEIKQIGAANLFLTGNEARTEELQNNYKQLRVQTFQGIASQLNVTPEELLSRHPQDPLGYTKLHGALIDSCLRDRNSRIEAQKIEIAAQKAELNRLQQELSIPLKTLIIRKIKQKF